MKVAGDMNRGLTIWMTGLSGAGKTTISEMVAQKLQQDGRRIEVLDGDVMRESLTKGLGFSKEDRFTNVDRIAYVADLLTHHGVIVIVPVISPYQEMRENARKKIGRFVEVYVNAPLAVCEQRDVKGLYKKARAGEIKGFTGVSDPYEEPIDPDIVCYTAEETCAQSAEKIINFVNSIVNPHPTYADRLSFFSRLQQAA
jgi:adenylylsulfate kinase